VTAPGLEPIDGGSRERILAAVREGVARAGSSARVGVAADFLAHLIRSPFDPDAVGLVSMGLSPTSHRADDDTVLENLVGIEDEVEALRHRMGDRPVLVGPVTLATRHGPYPDGPPDPLGLPPSVDVRQPSLLAAAWTVGCLAALAPAGPDALALAGPDALTLFETAGWRGTFEREAGPALPDRFPSAPGAVFPLWHVLADLAEWRTGRLLAVTGPEGKVAALGFENGRARHLLVASLRRVSQEVTLRGLAGERARVRTLDVASAAEASREPEAFRASMSDVAVRSGELSLALDAYAVARVDWFADAGRPG
jgi:hypothetical protein